MTPPQSSWASPQVVGVGAATWDHFWVVPDFSSAESVQEARLHLQTGGGPVATALCVLGWLGHPCALVDSSGDDPAAAAIQRELESFGVSTTRFTRVAGASSAQATVLVRAADGARQIVYAPSTAGEPVLGPAELAIIRQARLLHLNGRHETAARIALHTALEHGVTVSFDGGAGRYRESVRDLVSASHLRILALDFARQFCGSEDLQEISRRLLQPPAQLLVITDGLRGSHVFLPDGTCLHQPAYPAAPLVDTTGCGDVYHGAFLHGWLRQWSPARSADFASRLAAKNAQGLGGRFTCSGPQVTEADAESAAL